MHDISGLLGWIIIQAYDDVLVLSNGKECVRIEVHDAQKGTRFSQEASERGKVRVLSLGDSEFGIFPQEKDEVI